MYRIVKRNTKKLDILLKQDKKLFHSNDLALLWQISDKNTLYTTTKRYVKRGFLIRLHKGFFSTVDPDKLDPVLLGMSYLHTYTYLSTESVLVKEGIIAQDIPYITLISSVSKSFRIGAYDYKVRQLKDSLLYQSLGIVNTDPYLMASLERAVADLLYFNPSYHFDGHSLINWQKVKNIQKKAGFK